MTIREKVARAIEREDFGEGGPSHRKRMATAAITAFLEAAAEPDDRGVSWRMCPDEATEEMVSTGPFTPAAYRAMLADPTAQFEWDK